MAKFVVNCHSLLFECTAVAVYPGELGAAGGHD